MHDFFWRFQEIKVLSKHVNSKNPKAKGFLELKEGLLRLLEEQ